MPRPLNAAAIDSRYERYYHALLIVRSSEQSQLRHLKKTIVNLCADIERLPDGLIKNGLSRQATEAHQQIEALVCSGSCST